MLWRVRLPWQRAALFICVLIGGVESPAFKSFELLSIVPNKLLLIRQAPCSLLIVLLWLQFDVLVLSWADGVRGGTEGFRSPHQRLDAL